MWKLGVVKHGNSHYSDIYHIFCFKSQFASMPQLLVDIPPNMADDRSDVESNFEEEETPTRNKTGWGTPKKLAVALLLAIGVVLVVTIPVVTTRKNSSKQSAAGVSTGDGASLTTSSGSSGAGIDLDSDNDAETPVFDVVDDVKPEETTTTTTSTEQQEDQETTTTTSTEQQEDQDQETTTTTAEVLTQAVTQTACPAMNFTRSEGQKSWIEIAEAVKGEESFDLSGFDIDMSADGNIIAVASTMNDGNGDKSGHVRIFKFTSGKGFHQLGQDIDGENTLDWFGSSVSLDASGFRVAVGARWNDGANGEDSGHVRVFDYYPDEDTWIQVGKDIDGMASGDQLGRAVSLSADGMRLAAGAPNADANEGVSNSGHVYIFDLVDGNWESIGKVEGEAAMDLSGKGVSLSADGSHVAIGAYKHDGSNGQPDVGQVKVFRYDSSTAIWSQVGQDVDGEAPGDWAGSVLSISADGKRVAVAVPGDDSNFLPGVTRVYELEGDTWIKMGAQDLKGGFAVSLTSDGNRVAVGDYKGFNSGINSGYTNIYEYNAETLTWDLVGQEINGSPLEMSGTAVAISSDGLRVAVSSPAYTSSGNQQVGATRVFDLC